MQLVDAERCSLLAIDGPDLTDDAAAHAHGQHR